MWRGQGKGSSLQSLYRTLPWLTQTWTRYCQISSPPERSSHKARVKRGKEMKGYTAHSKREEAGMRALRFLDVHYLN